MADYDLIVRGGLVVDGTGAAPFVADVAIRDGLIAAVGKVDGTAPEEINANGKLVTPGFVDVHTHYDGQVTWEETVTASSAHGVTTVVMGNCGVGFAPCREGDREALIAMMEGVEDIPEVVMATGVPWNWETFPEYLDVLDSRRYDIDLAAQLPHSALRVYVMGDRAIRREVATDADCVRMAELTREALEAGAIGFATSRLHLHRDRSGELIPSIGAQANELMAVAQAMREVGKGVIETVVNIDDDFDHEFDLMRMMVKESGRPLSFSLAQLVDHPTLWSKVLDMVEDARKEGIPIKAQVIGRPTGMLLGLELSFNPFSFYPTYQRIAHLPLAERLERLRDPEVRAQILGEAPTKDAPPIFKYLGLFEWMFRLGDPPLYEPPLDTSMAAIARREGRTPQEIAYDMLLEEDGQAILFQPVANYADGNLEAARQMMTDPNTILGLGDGGAHYGMIMDSSYPTFMLTYWVRDREGEKIDLPKVVRALSRDTATAVGLNDRGQLKVGFKGDCNVIDFDRLKLRMPRPQNDLPAGGRRLMQAAEGFAATIVSGHVIHRDGRPTGARPGRLVRGMRAAPAT